MSSRVSSTRTDFSPSSALLANPLDFFAPSAPETFHAGLTHGGGTQQLCGVRPARRCPAHRLRLLSEAAPQNLFRAAPWPFKPAGSVGSRRTAGTNHRPPEPVGGGATAKVCARPQLDSGSGLGRRTRA